VRCGFDQCAAVRDNSFPNFHFDVTGIKIVDAFSHATLKVLGHGYEVDAKLSGERII
jgi:hypothetical protein